MKNVRVLTTVGMLLAISVVLGFFKLPITELVELRFQFLPVACAGMLFGPVTGALMGGLSDILCYIVRPTGPFFPGFTISAVIQGIIYGSMLHKNVTLKRIIAAQLLDTVIVSLILNPIWLSILYGQGFIAVFAARIIKSIVMFPINTILLAAVLKPAQRFGVGIFKGAEGASR